MEVLVIDVAHGPGLEKEAVAVRRVGPERLRFALAGSRPHAGAARQPTERVRQPKRPVVMEVVPDEHVGRRRLRRGALERGVRLDDPFHDLVAGGRSADHADPAVVVRHVFEQPIDGVIGVAVLIDLPARLLRHVRPHHHKLAFGFVLPAHILLDENKPLVFKLERMPRRPEVGAARLRTGINPVRRAKEEEGQIFVLLSRRIDHGVELDPVAHGNHVFLRGCNAP